VICLKLFKNGGKKRKIKLKKQEKD